MRLKTGVIYYIESNNGRVLILETEVVIRGQALVKVRRLKDNKEIYLPAEAFETAQSEQDLG